MRSLCFFRASRILQISMSAQRVQTILPLRENPGVCSDCLFSHSILQFTTPANVSFLFAEVTAMTYFRQTDGGVDRPLLHAKFHLHRCNVSPLRCEKPQNRPLSNLYTGALRCAHAVCNYTLRYSKLLQFSMNCDSNSAALLTTLHLANQSLTRM